MFTVGFSDDKDPSKNWLKTFETWKGLYDGSIPERVADMVNYYASRCEDKLSIAIAMNGETLLITFE